MAVDVGARDAGIASVAVGGIVLGGDSAVKLAVEAVLGRPTARIR
jgi:hypothetical protein